MSTFSDNTFNELPDDSKVESRARGIFRTACEHADPYYALRLGLARRKAVNAGAKPHALRVWAPLTGAAACCALALGAVWMHPLRQASPAATSVSSAPIANAEPLDSQEDLPPEIDSGQMEMVQDLDFYRWLASQPAVASAAHRSSR
jgi:hypothetical protein